MSRIKSKWTKQEVATHNYLKSKGIKHEMHPGILGSPDITIKSKKIAIFLNGCFWHGCPHHFRLPKTNTVFWAQKIKNNKKRDKMNTRLLRKEGWVVIGVWEHSLNNQPNRILPHIIEQIRTTKTRRNIQGGLW